MNDKLKPFMKILSGIVIGGILGFTYYWFIGCKTGTCRITGNPLISSLYGSFMGLIWVFPSNWKKKK